MTLIQSLTDPVTWDTIKELSPIFIILASLWFILFCMFLFLSRPRNYHYEAFKPQIKSRNRAKSWIRSLWPFKPKTRSYSLQNSQQRNTSANEFAISNVGRDIDDIHCNRGNTNFSIPSYPSNGIECVDTYITSGFDGISRDSSK